MIKFENFSFAYNRKSPFEHQIFKDVNLELNKNKTLLLGLSGSGKSTLFRLLLDDLKPSTGRIVKPKKIGFVFQNVYAQILMSTVYDELNLTYKQVNGKNISEAEINTYFELFKVDFDLKQNPHNLSGGQKRILVLICILISKPDYLILDEPFVGLDKIRRECLVEFLKTCETPFLLSTHDLKDNYQLYDDIVSIVDNEMIKIDFKTATKLGIIGDIKRGDINE